MPETGPRIDGVTVRRRLAVGGMAEVFLADQALAGGGSRVVVIKQLLPGADPLWRSLFAREREALAAIESPHVVQLLAGTDDHLLLEFIDGPDLSALLAWHGKRGRVLSPGAALAAAQGLLEGLIAVHGAHDAAGSPLGLVHRDINPSNVLVTPSGGIKLIDLGVARMTAVEQTTVAGVKGTLGYMAPEQLAGRPVDQRADLYAAGLVIYELLTGVPARPPGSAGLGELIASRSRLPAPPSSLRSHLPEALDHALLAALAPRPGDRPTDAAALLVLLREAGIPPAGAELAAAAQQVALGAPALERTIGPSPNPSASATTGPPQQDAASDATRAVSGPEDIVPGSTPPAPALAHPVDAGRAPDRPSRVGAWVAALAVLAATAILGLAGAERWASAPRTTPSHPGPAASTLRPGPGASEAGSLAPGTPSAIVTPVEVEPATSDAGDGGPLSSRTPNSGQADALDLPHETSRPPETAPRLEAAPPDEPTAAPAGPQPDTDVSTPPRLEFRGDGHSLYVQGPGTSGLAPRRSLPFGSGPQVFTVAGGTTTKLKATLRVTWAATGFKARLQGADGTAFDTIRCGARSYGPSAALSFRRSIACSATTAAGSALSFRLRAVSSH